MIPKFGPVELILILVIVTMLFGVGKLPEVFGSVGRGIREFRKNSTDPQEPTTIETVETVETVESVSPASVASAPVAEPAEKQVVH
jgi:sec-independent protein translocase protein TatA